MSGARPDAAVAAKTMNTVVSPPAGGAGFEVKPLEREPLLEAAIKRAGGFDDFGTDSFEIGLGHLLPSIHAEANLNPIGQIMLQNQIVSGLANRLIIVEWEKRNPEHAAAPVKAPMIVVGLPRTGTTILFEVLAAQARHRAVMTWEALDFALAHAAADDPEAHPGVQAIAARLQMAEQLMPGFAAIHKFGAFIPTECVSLTLIDLASEQFGANAYLKSYRDWLVEADFTSAFDWHKRALRYLQATQPDKRWLLKTPMHSGYLPELFAAYPDAMVVQTHREPMEVIASVSNLYKVSRSAGSDHYETKAYANDDARYYARLIEKCVADRRAHPEWAERFYDVAFKDFLADPVAVTEKIHAHFGYHLPADERQAMADYIADRPRDKYGVHTYDAADYGLTEAVHGALFADYRAAFGRLI